MLIGEIRWDEKAGLRTGCGVRSQVIDVLEAQIKRRPAMKKVSTVAAKPSKKISQQKLTIGLDLGDRNSWYCVLYEAGQIQLEQRVVAAGAKHFNKLHHLRHLRKYFSRTKEPLHVFPTSNKRGLEYFVHQESNPFKGSECRALQRAPGPARPRKLDGTDIAREAMLRPVPATS